MGDAGRGICAASSRPSRQHVPYPLEEFSNMCSNFLLTTIPHSLAPYERRVIELLRNSKDKRARKLAKKRVCRTQTPQSPHDISTNSQRSSVPSVVPRPRLTSSSASSLRPAVLVTKSTRFDLIFGNLAPNGVRMAWSRFDRLKKINGLDAPWQGFSCGSPEYQHFQEVYGVMIKPCSNLSFVMSDASPSFSNLHPLHAICFHDLWISLFCAMKKLP